MSSETQQQVSVSINHEGFLHHLDTDLSIQLGSHNAFAEQDNVSCENGMQYELELAKRGIMLSRYQIPRDNRLDCLRSLLADEATNPTSSIEDARGTIIHTTVIHAMAIHAMAIRDKAGANLPSTWYFRRETKTGRLNEEFPHSSLRMTLSLAEEKQQGSHWSAPLSAADSIKGCTGQGLAPLTAETAHMYMLSLLGDELLPACILFSGGAGT